MAAINFHSIHEEIHRPLIDRVYENLAFPESTFLGTRITKKMLVDNNDLSSNDKKLITDVIQSIEWQNTLKPETLNVPIYVTDTVEYAEIAVIRVVLKDGNKLTSSSLSNVAKLFHTLIPYPVILLLEYSEKLVISLADKRINQANKSKLLIENMYNSAWLSAMYLTENENEFLNDFSLKNVSHLNYFELYQDFISMLIGLKVSEITGLYVSKNSQYKDTSSFIQKSNEDKTALLKELEAFEAELSSIRNKIKKETQMNMKMHLNVEAKKVKDSIGKLKSSLSAE